MTRNYSLLRLLGPGSLRVHVSAQIRGIGRLSHNALERGPGLAGDGRGALVGHGGIDAGRQLADDRLNEAALGVAGPQEGRVGEREEDGAAAESKKRDEHAEPGDELEQGDESHAGVIVLLDESAQGLGQGGLLRLRLAIGRSILLLAFVRGRGLEHGDQVAAGVGRDMEN